MTRSRKKPFPVGCCNGQSDAYHVDLVSWQLMPRALDIKAFLDEGDRFGLKYPIETMLGIADEMFSGLALLWGAEPRRAGADD